MVTLLKRGVTYTVFGNSVDPDRLQAIVECREHVCLLHVVRVMPARDHVIMEEGQSVVRPWKHSLPGGIENNRNKNPK